MAAEELPRWATIKQAAAYYPDQRADGVRSLIAHGRPKWAT